MRRVNLMVSDKAKEKLVDFQHLHRMQTQDEALDKILLDLEVKAIQVSKDNASD